MDRREWADEIFRAHAEGLFRYLRTFRLSADDTYDLVQTAFLKLIEMKPNQIKHPKAWLYSVGRNLAIDLIRRNRARPESGNVDELTDGSRGVCDTLEQDEEHALLRQSFNELPKSDREMLRLHLEHELSYARIATIMKKSEISVRVAMHRARKELKKKLALRMSA